MLSVERKRRNGNAKMKVNNIQTQGTTFRPLFKAENTQACQPLRDEFVRAEQLADTINRNSRKRAWEVLLHGLYGAGIGAFLTLIFCRK